MSAAISKIERLCGALKHLKLWTLLTLTPSLPSNRPCRLLLLGYILPTLSSLYSLETNKKKKKELAFWH